MRVSGRCATSCTRAWLGTWQNKRQSNAKKQTILLPSLTPVHRVHDPPQAQDSLKESSCAGCCAVSCNTAQDAGRGILAALSTVLTGSIFLSRDGCTFLRQKLRRHERELVRRMLRRILQYCAECWTRHSCSSFHRLTGCIFLSPCGYVSCRLVGAFSCRRSTRQHERRALHRMLHSFQEHCSRFCGCQNLRKTEEPQEKKIIVDMLVCLK